jgi:hypothetical protein
MRPTNADFQSQHSPLHPPHLLHAYLMLLALRSTGKQWMAFYNCGELSGASQKRRQCVNRKDRLRTESPLLIRLACCLHYAQPPVCPRRG